MNKTILGLIIAGIAIGGLVTADVIKSFIIVHKCINSFKKDNFMEKEDFENFKNENEKKDSK